MAVHEQRWQVGPLVVVGPTRFTTSKGNTAWRVVAVDSSIEETAEKVFSSAVKAQTFIDGLVSGAAPIDPLEEARGTMASADNRSGSNGLHERAETTPTPPTLNHRHTRVDPYTGLKDPERSPFNLKSVVEALTGEGLDPFVEVARVLKERVPVVDRNGQPVIDRETGKPVTVPKIGGVERAKLLVELGQYVSPKLKAVDVKVEDKGALTEEQLDQRIAAIYARRAAELAKTTEVTEGAGQ